MTGTHFYYLDNVCINLSESKLSKFVKFYSRMFLLKVKKNSIISVVRNYLDLILQNVLSLAFAVYNFYQRNKKRLSLFLLLLLFLILQTVKKSDYTINTLF